MLTFICRDTGCAIILGTFLGADRFLGIFLDCSRIFGYCFLLVKFVCLRITQNFLQLLNYDNIQKKVSSSSFDNEFICRGYLSE